MFYNYSNNTSKYFDFQYFYNVGSPCSKCILRYPQVGFFLACSKQIAGFPKWSLKTNKRKSISKICVTINFQKCLFLIKVYSDFWSLNADKGNVFIVVSNPIYEIFLLNDCVLYWTSKRQGSYHQL